MKNISSKKSNPMTCYHLVNFISILIRKKKKAAATRGQFSEILENPSNKDSYLFRDEMTRLLILIYVMYKLIKIVILKEKYSGCLIPSRESTQFLTQSFIFAN